MHRIFQRFIDSLAESGDLVALRDSMAETAAALDLHCFAYLSLSRKPGEKPQYITTYPSSWTTHYLQNRYERLDPVVKQVLSSTEPFEWGLGIGPAGMPEPQRRLLHEAAEFGLQNGFTVPIHDGRGPISAVTFATSTRHALAFRQRVEEHRRVLQLMAMYFHAHVRRKLASARKIDGVQLSPRELECLEWATRGKTAWEVGCILGISRSTVASYLDNAKEKLGVRTIVQAAMRLAAAKGEKQN
jgi:LuxR family transcriptional activator of conjugal transfer of Ti plasmids